jgi:hypothetical protein
MQHITRLQFLFGFLQQSISFRRGQSALGILVLTVDKSLGVLCNSAFVMVARMIWE